MFRGLRQKVDIFLYTDVMAKWRLICFRIPRGAFDVLPVLSCYVETVCLLSKLNVEHHIEEKLNLDETDLTVAESKATYEEIKAYVKEKMGLQVSNLNITRVKQKSSTIERKNYNKSKSEDAKIPKCTLEKETAIMEALKYFEMIEHVQKY